MTTGDPAAAQVDEQLLALLTDPEVIQTITAQHVLLRPRQGLLRVFVPARLVA
ncbi:MAG: hypothetical protein AB7N76_37240 [Planctomycetota bacterium]